MGEAVPIFRGKKRFRLFPERKRLNDPAAAPKWYPLDLPMDGLSLALRNEDGAALLDVTFMEDPNGEADPPFFQLAARGVIGAVLDTDFIPRHLWVRQNANPQLVYWHVIDEVE